MRFNWLSRIRLKKDLFVHTHYRLTFRYSVLIMIFLTVFITMVYFLVGMFSSLDQERLIQRISDAEASSIQDALNDHTLNQQTFEVIGGSENQTFYLIADTKGNPLFADQFAHRFQEKVLPLVKEWVPQNQEIRHGTLILPPPSMKRGLPPPPPGDHQVNLIITGRPIYQGNQLVGIFYMGKDISFIDEHMNRLLLILVEIGVLFFGIAVLLSFSMSKRAMIPIKHSFQRQREFVADASHELRTPLSILQSSLDVFELEGVEQLSEFSREVLFNMKDEVKRMSNLINDLLTLARSDSGVPDLRNETFDFAPSVEQMVRSTQSLAHPKQISLNLQAPPSLMISGDHERLKQLLYIMLDNAIKYTPNGGTVNLKLTVVSVEKKPCVSILVEDTGVGIPAEYRDRIFDRFFRGSKNRSRQMGGTGLGLSIAKWIVDAHQGKIKVSSTVGKGSTFTIILPMVR